MDKSNNVIFASEAGKMLFDNMQKNVVTAIEIIKSKVLAQYDILEKEVQGLFAMCVLVRLRHIKESAVEILAEGFHKALIENLGRDRYLYICSKTEQYKSVYIRDSEQTVKGSSLDELFGQTFFFSLPCLPNQEEIMLPAKCAEGYLKFLATWDEFEDVDIIPDLTATEVNESVAEDILVNEAIWVHVPEESHEQYKLWRDDEGVILEVSCIAFDKVLHEKINSEEATREYYYKNFAKEGVGLIQCHLSETNGQRCVKVIGKAFGETGYVRYLGSLAIPLKGKSFVLSLAAEERGKDLKALTQVKNRLDELVTDIKFSDHLRERIKTTS